MIALDYREPRPCYVRLSLLHVLLLLPSLLHPPVHRSGVNLCPNLIIHICQPASCNVSHSLSLSLSPSLERLVATREEGRGEKNKHPVPRKWGYITININGSPVSSNFNPLLLFFPLERVVRSRVHRSASIVFIGPCSTKFRVYYRGGERGGGGTGSSRISFEKSLPDTRRYSINVTSGFIQMYRSFPFLQETLTLNLVTYRIIGSIYPESICLFSSHRKRS